MTARRILICLHDFARGGTERIAIGLAGDWAGVGRDVTILCGTTEGGLRDTVDGRVKVVALDPPIPRSALSRLRLGRAMSRYLPELQPDVVFLPGNFHLFLARGLRHADPRLPIVLKISNPPLPHGLTALPGRMVFRHFARAIDGFATLTSGFAREVATLAPGKPAPVLHDPIYLIPGEATHAAPDGVCNILWAGRLEPQKDIGLALRTIAVLNGQRPSHLTILGDGNLREQTDQMVARMGLGAIITRIGHVSSIDPWLARADVLLMTSHYEGQPAVVGEALAHGVPVVSTDCSDMLRDVITIPEAGKVVASREPAALAAALREVCEAPRPPRERLAALVAPFEPERCARAYLNFFDTMVAP
ncbi:MAG TPA: glycosyltransferase [Rhizomicrobium sp.]|jgi:glycosyltransferase involved in cell wall biosynthesis